MTELKRKPLPDIEEQDALKKLPDVEQSLPSVANSEVLSERQQAKAREEQERLMKGRERAEYFEKRRATRKELAKLPLIELIPPTALYRAIRHVKLERKSALKKSREK